MIAVSPAPPAPLMSSTRGPHRSGGTCNRPTQVSNEAPGLRLIGVVNLRGFVWFVGFTYRVTILGL